MSATNSNASLKVDRHVAEGRGEVAAYIARTGSLTYEQLRRQVNRMGRLLRDLGVRREQRVLLVLDDTTAFPVAFLGAMRIGAVPVPVSVRETEANFRHFIEDSYAEVVVCDEAVLEKLQAALPDHDVRFLVNGAGEGATGLETALAAQDDELDAVATHPDDMAFWLYTSGSTGKPKGAVHLHHSFEVGPATFGRHILAMGEQDRVFSTTKFYHAYGLGNSVSYPLHFGATAVVLDGMPSPERLIATLREHQPTIYFSVPALYRQLVGDPDADGALDSVRLCISAAEPLPLRTFEQWRDRFGLEIVDGIGTTEMWVTFCSNRPGAVVPGTTGRPVPGYELRLTDEDGLPLEGACEGNLEVRGDSTAAYYWHQYARSRRQMRGEWFATGDRYRRTEDDYYVYVGRADDMFKVAGLWVSPVDMEHVLLEHPAVAAAAVIGTTVDDYTRLAAFVKCNEGESADDELRDSLRSWCRDRLREYEYPHIIRFVDELPLTLTGKPQRFKLRELMEKELGPANGASSPGAAQASAPGATVADPAPGAPLQTPPRGAERAAAAVSVLSRAPRKLNLVELPEAERDEAALGLVLGEMSEMMEELSAETIDPERTFKELGFDSIAAVELRNRLEQRSRGAAPLDADLRLSHPAGRRRAAAGTGGRARARAGAGRGGPWGPGRGAARGRAAARAAADAERGSRRHGEHVVAAVGPATANGGLEGHTRGAVGLGAQRRRARGCPRGGGDDRRRHLARAGAGRARARASDREQRSTARCSGAGPGLRSSTPPRPPACRRRCRRTGRCC